MTSSSPPSPHLPFSASPSDLAPSSAPDLPSPNSDLRGASAPFRLAHWPTAHEPARSLRTDEVPDRLLIPTNPDSLGYRLLCAEPDAIGLWGAWMLLVGIAGRHARPLRGFLVHPSGVPYTPADLAAMTGFSAALFERALAFFSDPRLGWLVPAEPGAIPAALRELADTRALREKLARERHQIARIHGEERRRHRARVRLVEQVAAPADREAALAHLAQEEKIIIEGNARYEETWTYDPPRVDPSEPFARAHADLGPDFQTPGSDVVPPSGRLFETETIRLPAKTPPTSASVSAAVAVSTAPGANADRPAAPELQSERPSPQSLSAPIPPPNPAPASGDAAGPDEIIPGIPRNWRALLLELARPATAEYREKLEKISWHSLTRDTHIMISDHPNARYA